MGKWFEELSRFDLDMLVDMTERFEEQGTEGEVIFVLTEMLTSAEGVQILDAERAKKRVSHFISLLVIESLYRKGSLEVDHAAFSFGEDEMDKIVAWPKGTEKPPNPPRKKSR